MGQHDTEPAMEDTEVQESAPWTRSPRGEPAPIRLPGRYTDLGRLAQGGFGEVHRVRDTLLDRTLVMKILHRALCDRPAVRRRFFDEVRITARLQHPGIVPVHDHGELPDGRLWYTMKEVRGRTFGAIVRELHAASGPAGFGTTASGWTFRRTLDALARMAQAVAHAHAMGVFHRDIKPENLMIGELGEALVMDWGLARHARGAETEEWGGGDVDPRALDSAGAAGLTRQGDVLGTPAYMPPEQARGERDRHGPHSDVYALGAVLYHLLSGRPPYVGSVPDVLEAILAGPPPPVEVAATGGPPVPAELAAACARAMAPEIEARGTAGELAADLFAWLDGARRREQALSVLEEASSLLPEIERLRAGAETANAEARALLAPVRPFDPIEAKRPAWRLEDQAAELRRAAALAETKWLQLVHGALTLDADLPEAHALLADHYKNSLAEAERAHEDEDAARSEAMLRAHDRGRYAAFLRGAGAVTLVTDPPGATVTLHRYVLQDRRLVPVFERALGVTPLREAPVERGSYLLVLRAPGRAEVRYPILIERAGHWDGIPPGDSEPFPIVLPEEGELGPDDCYVPAGWCWIGGDPEAPDSLPARRIWVDGFVIGRDPVTCRQWSAFLDDLVAGGFEAEALAACPRRQLGVAGGGEVRPAWERDAAGRFALPADWLPDTPIVLIDWHAASAHARWRARRAGLPWRLPNELEREKAARGVDGRPLPWGYQLDATFACAVESHRGEPGRVEVGAYPADESPLGARGLAGNVREWCINLWKQDGPLVEGSRLRVDPAPADDPDFRVIRGGGWGNPMTNGRAAARFGGRPGMCWLQVGVRAVRAYPA